MKKIIMLFFVALVCSAGNAQNQFLKVYKSAPNPSYQDYIKVLGVEYTDIYPGNIFVLTYQQSGFSVDQNRLTLLKLDTTGNILSSHSYFTQMDFLSWARYQNLSIDESGNIFIAGKYATSLSTNEDDGVLLKVDTSGNVLFSKLYSSWDSGSQGDDDGITVVKNLNTGGNSTELYVAGGMEVSATFGCSNPYVDKINKSSGLVEWHHEVELNACTDAMDINLLPSQDIVLWVKNPFPYEIAFIKFDSTGNLLNFPYGFDVQGSSTAFFDVDHVFSSNFISMVCGIQMNNSGQYSIYAFTADVSGNVMWKKRYNVNKNLSIETIRAIESNDKDAFYIMCGANGNINAPSSIIILKIDKNDGNIIWVKNSGASFAENSRVLDRPIQIIEINHSLYIFGETNMPSSNPLIYCLKTDKDGNWGKDCNDNIPVLLTPDSSINIVASNLAFVSDVTYGIGNLTPVDTSISYTTETYPDVSGLPVAGVSANPNPACANNTITIIDNSQNQYAGKNKLFDNGFWWDYYPNNTYTTGDEINDSIWHYAYETSLTNYTYCPDSALAVVQIVPYSFVPGFTYTINQFDVQFTDTTSWAVSWLWDFGDGATDTIQNPKHTFATGNYQVCLRVWNLCYNSVQTCQNIIISDIDEHKKENVKITPNPSSGKINISAPFNMESIEIYDTKGRNVKSLKNIGVKSVQVDLSGLFNGIYFVKIKDKENSLIGSQKIYILK